MAASKVTTIKRLKDIFKQKLDEVYGKKIRELEHDISIIREEVNKEIMFDIEKMVTDKYPNLVLPLKCDYGNKHDYTDSSIKVVFKNDITTEDIKSLTDEIIAIRAQFNMKEKELSEWEIKTLEANIKEEGFPTFNVE